MNFKEYLITESKKVTITVDDFSDWDSFKRAKDDDMIDLKKAMKKAKVTMKLKKAGGGSSGDDVVTLTGPEEGVKMIISDYIGEE